jgi:hypothetical protein
MSNAKRPRRAALTNYFCAAVWPLGRSFGHSLGLGNALVSELFTNARRLS